LNLFKPRKIKERQEELLNLAIQFKIDFPKILEQIEEVYENQIKYFPYPEGLIFYIVEDKNKHVFLSHLNFNNSGNKEFTILEMLSDLTFLINHPRNLIISSICLTDSREFLYRKDKDELIKKWGKGIISTFKENYNGNKILQ